MNYFKLLSVLFVFSLTSLIVNAEHVSDPSLVAKGAKLYSENCGRCHNPRPASDYSKKEWSVVMPHMREKAHMTGKEALAVEAFLASTLTSDVRNKLNVASKSSEPINASKLITQYGCQGCHVINKLGGTLGPNLDVTIKEKGEEYAIKKIKKPKFDNSASAMPQFPMSDEEIKALVRFLSRE